MCSSAPANRKDKWVIVEALYLASENHEQFVLAGNWNMTGQLVRKALGRLPSVQHWDVTDTSSKNTWIIANCELHHMILPAAARHPGADDTWPGVMATVMPLRPRGASEASGHDPLTALMRHKAESAIELMEKIVAKRKEPQEVNYEVRCKGMASIRRQVMANIKRFCALTPSAFFQVNNEWHALHRDLLQELRIQVEEADAAYSRAAEERDAHLFNEVKMQMLAGETQLLCRREIDNSFFFRDRAGENEF